VLSVSEYKHAVTVKKLENARRELEARCAQTLEDSEIRVRHEIKCLEAEKQKEIDSLQVPPRSCGVYLNVTLS